VFLTPAEADAIEARVARLEASTGVQAVTAIVGRSDPYPEILWKAFALGVAIAALAVVVQDYLRPDWTSAHAAWSNVTLILGCGGASAVLAIAWPTYARLFLNRVRSHDEVLQYAQATFLERQLFRTLARNGILLCASLFERRVELIADIGYHGQLVKRDWATVIDAMTPLLAGARPADAMLRGLDHLEDLLLSKGFIGPAADNELANQPIDEAGTA
jgi:uncharacterized membrane protein